jgi:hypothetical protein
MAIVVTHYRYRPPPKKPKKLAVAVEVPVVVTKQPQIVVSISRKRARLLAAARESERFMEPRAVDDDAATARAMEAIARALGRKPSKGRDGA